MKTDQFVLEYLDRQKRNFTESISKAFLPTKPYEAVLEDLEELRLTTAILNAPTIEQVVKVLKSVQYVYLPEPTPVRDILIDLEIIVENKGFYLKINSVLNRLPSRYGIRAKVYELLHTM